MFEKLIEMALSGVVGNTAYDQLKTLFAHSNEPSAQDVIVCDNDPDVQESHGENIEYVHRYKTFDLFEDLNTVLALAKQPIAHFVVEDQPTTAWHLPCVVVEDAVTSEWYVFSKGNIAFEGTGTGIHQMESLVRFLLDKHIPFTAWVLDRINADKLDQGCRTWGELKAKCVPLLAHRGSEYFEKYVAGKYAELSRV